MCFTIKYGLKREYSSLEAYSAFPNMTSLWTLRKTKLDSIFFLIFYLFVWMSFPST